MPDLSIAGPLAENHFSDERRLDPVRVPAEPPCWTRGKRTSGLFDGIELPPQIERARGGKPRSDFPREDEPSLVVVVAGKQRTDPLPRAFRIGEPADHELLAQHAFRSEEHTSELQSR